MSFYLRRFQTIPVLKEFESQAKFLHQNSSKHEPILTLLHCLSLSTPIIICYHFRLTINVGFRIMQNFPISRIYWTLRLCAKTGECGLRDNKIMTKRLEGRNPKV